ncbi:hypothetical protein [Sphingomonas aquatilis]|uniref:Uncharacterized protein n=1 Tax=Sphingomonas aquatilis TaxID=93063 RepID=A0AAW3TVN3_9SPHN|nr:hypothetical protein [Sphingomonas aquatilis]MBB3876997.1 hypothetical protein [Sphingomonas aquatilis]
MLSFAFSLGIGDDRVGELRQHYAFITDLMRHYGQTTNWHRDRAFLAEGVAMELMQFGIPAERAVALVAPADRILDALQREWDEPGSVPLLIAQFPTRMTVNSDIAVGRDPLALVDAAAVFEWLEAKTDAVGRLLLLRVSDLVQRLRRGVQRQR